jgi:formylglycine-generating enzyme required for sulfatase activity
MDRYEHPNQVGEYPTQQLSWEQAQEMCQQDGKRVCSEAEWTLACEGPDVKGYPYGAIYESQRCGTKDQMGTELQRIGAHPKCSTPDGIEDLTGSVWEWTLTQDGQNGVLRGGGSILSAGLGRCRSRAFVGEVDRVDVGVRCCLTPSQDTP